MVYSFKHCVCLFVSVILLFVLTGCGSSGSSSSDSDDNALTITADLFDTAGNETRTISTGNPGTLRVTLHGSSVENQLVTVTTTKGSFLNSDGTALTDSNGVAEFVLQADDATGAGEINVTAGDFSLETPFAFQINIPSQVKLGAFINGVFNEGVLDSSLNPGETLSIGGTATITASLAVLNSNNEYELYTSPIDITFTTKCAGAVIDNSVTTVNGTATAIYRSDQCQGTSDIITARASSVGENLMATATILLADTGVGSIEFVSAEPDLIAIKGSANSDKPSTSVVKFLVKDTLGNPVMGKQVNFELITNAGGLSLTPDHAESDADGMVQVVVSSGNQPTHVRVKATIADTSITTQSDTLAVSTGYPDQNSFSISADILNPEAWNYDGEVVNITVRAADHFNNPVADGTMISFITNGGVVEPSCTTVDGACSVEWRSQNPRPDSGRAVVLATSVGEESFTDQNGSGLYEADYDDFYVNEDDLPEAYIDVNENGSRDINEEFIDFNGDTFYTPGNGEYNGTLCSEGCSTELVDVRESIVISMSGSEATIVITESNEEDGDSQELKKIEDLKEMTRFKITISDDNGNSMPSGTTLDVTAPDNATIEGDSSFTVQNTIDPNVFYISLKPTDDALESGATGNMVLKVTTPKEIVTSKSVSVTVLSP